MEYLKTIKNGDEVIASLKKKVDSLTQDNDALNAQLDKLKEIHPALFEDDKQEKAKVSKSKGIRTRHILRRIGKSPLLQTVVGMVMLGASLGGQQGDLIADLMQFNVRLHHGIGLMGIWQIVQALPNLMDSFNWIFNRQLDEEE